MKLAYFSPLTPQRSGISDYSEELLPHLAAGAEITLFVDGFQPVNRELTSRLEVLDYRRQRSHLKKLAEFDIVLYHMGNDHRYHAGILEAMQTRSGVIVFHDFALQDFFLGLARATRDLRIYLDEVENCHGKTARDQAAEELSRGATPAIVSRPVDFPLNCRLAKGAEGIIVHSESSRARFAARVPGVATVRIPMPIEFPPMPARQAVGTDVVNIATFGLIIPGKGIERSLRALANLKATHQFRYSLIGEANSFFEVRDLIRDYGLEDCCEMTGHVSLEEFQRRMGETDIALIVRERTVGETSASLCRLMAAGVCAIVADVGWYSELPNDCIVKLPLHNLTDTLLQSYLSRLIKDAVLRTEIGENARRYAHQEHNVRRGAIAYLHFLREVIDRRARRQFIVSVKEEVARLRIQATDELFLRNVAQEVATIAPETITR